MSCVTSNEPESNLPRYLSLTIGLCCAALSVVTVACNGVLCAALYKNPLKCFRTPNSILLINLAISDLLTGCVVDVLYAAHFLAASHQKEIPGLYDAAATASFITVNVSTCTIVLLSVDRYIAVCRPFNYKNLMTRHRVMICITVSWLYCFVFSIGPHVGVPTNLYYLIDAHLHITTPIAIVTYTFVKIHNTFKTNANNNFLSNDFRTNRYKQEKLLVNTILMILIIAIISLLPYYITVHIDFYCRYYTQCPVSTAYDWFGWLSEPMEFVNSCINPLLNAYRLPKYKKSIKVTLGLIKLEKPECQVIGPITTQVIQVQSPICEKRWQISSLL